MGEQPLKSLLQLLKEDVKCQDIIKCGIPARKVYAVCEELASPPHLHELDKHIVSFKLHKKYEVPQSNVNTLMKLALWHVKRSPGLIDDAVCRHEVKLEEERVLNELKQKQEKEQQEKLEREARFQPTSSDNKDVDRSGCKFSVWKANPADDAIVATASESAVALMKRRASDQCSTSTDVIILSDENDASAKRSPVARRKSKRISAKINRTADPSSHDESDASEQERAEYKKRMRKRKANNGEKPSNDNEWEVLDILEYESDSDGTKRFRVKWKSSSRREYWPERLNWVKEKDMHCPELLAEFWQRENENNNREFEKTQQVVKTEADRHNNLVKKLKERGMFR